MSGRLDREVFSICGTRYGWDIDKEKAANLTLVDADEIHTPGIREYPLTLECRVLYQQEQDPDRTPEEIRKRFYGNGKDAEDYHTAYVGEIVSAYIIRED